MDMKKLIQRALFVLVAVVAFSGCAALSIRSTLNSLTPGLSRQQVMENRTIQYNLHATEFENDSYGNRIERLIFRLEVYDTNVLVGHDWVTLWFKNGTLVEKQNEFVPLPPTFPPLPIPVQSNNQGNSK